MNGATVYIFNCARFAKNKKKENNLKYVYFNSTWAWVPQNEKKKNNEINKMNYQSTPYSYRNLQKNPAKNTDVEKAKWKKIQELKKAILEHVKKEYELDGIICII
jgi:hypothetical protein